MGNYGKDQRLVKSTNTHHSLEEANVIHFKKKFDTFPYQTLNYSICFKYELFLALFLKPRHKLDKLC